jgi:hypothetical protein
MILFCQDLEFRSPQLNCTANFWEDCFNVVNYILFCFSFLLKSFFNNFSDVFSILKDFPYHFGGLIMGLDEVYNYFICSGEFIKLPFLYDFTDERKFLQLGLHPSDIRITDLPLNISPVSDRVVKFIKLDIG